MVYGGNICAVYRLPGLLLLQPDRDIIIGVAGVIVFLCITAASFFALAHRGILRRLRSSLLTAGLAMNAILSAVKCRRDFRQSEYVGYDDRIALCGACLL